MNRIVEILMNRDGMTKEDAEEVVAGMTEEVMNGEDPEEVLANTVGLEPDYIFDLI